MITQRLNAIFDFYNNLISASEEFKNYAQDKKFIATLFVLYREPYEIASLEEGKIKFFLK